MVARFLTDRVVLDVVDNISRPSFSETRRGGFDSDERVRLDESRVQRRRLCHYQGPHQPTRSRTVEPPQGSL